MATNRAASSLTEQAGRPLGVGAAGLALFPFETGIPFTEASMSGPSGERPAGDPELRALVELAQAFDPTKRSIPARMDTARLRNRRQGTR